MKNFGIKAAVIGAGNVGAACAFSLLSSGLLSEIVIVDINRNKACGEAMDIAHAAPLLHPTRIYEGDYADISESDLVIITAGAAQNPGETRLDLALRNYEILKAIMPQIVRYAPQAIVLIVTNPVDVLTYAAFRLSGLPRTQILGSGTVLDTSRMRHLLAQHTHVAPQNIHTLVVGEHGDSETALFSLTNIAGMSLKRYCESCGHCTGCLDEIAQHTLLQDVRNIAYDIIAKKGNTCYGIAQAVTRICAAVIRDEKAILTTSAVLDGEYGLSGLALSVPCVIGENGIERILPLELSENERKEFEHSALQIKNAVENLG